jgi:hypothetical protein
VSLAAGSHSQDDRASAQRVKEEKLTTGPVDEASIVPLRDNAMAMLKQGARHDDGKGHRLLIRETEDLRLAYAGHRRAANSAGERAGGQSLVVVVCAATLKMLKINLFSPGQAAAGSRKQ